MAHRPLWLALLAGAMLLVAAVASPAALADNKSSVANVNKKAPSWAATPQSGTTDDDTGTAGLQVSPASGSGKAVVVKLDVSDGNGHNDINFVNVTVYKSDNSTVHVAQGAGSKETGSSTTSRWSRSFTMNHYDAAGNYIVKFEATDKGGDSATVWITFVYQTLAALTLSASSVNMGPNGTATGVAPGSDNLAAPASVTVTNSGNSAIDLQLSGTNLVNGTNTLAVNNVYYSWNSDMTSRSALSTSAATNTTFSLATGASSTKAVYLAIVVPPGTRPGVYAGTVTLAAVADA